MESIWVQDTGNIPVSMMWYKEKNQKFKYKTFEYFSCFMITTF